MLSLPMFQREKQRLIYDLATRDLYTQDGTFLKHLECPLEKNWADLEAIELWDRRKRYCRCCDRSVYDFTNLAEWQIRWRLWVAPDACIYFSSAAQNIVINASAIPPTNLQSCPYRVIRQAYSEEEKHRAVACPLTIEGEPIAGATSLFLLPEDLQKDERVLLETTVGNLPGVLDPITNQPLPMRLMTRATWDGEGFDIFVEEEKKGIRGWWERLWLIG